MPEEGVTWENLSQHLYLKHYVQREIEKWCASSSKQFAGMPRPTDVGYGDRLGIAYESVRDKIEKVVASPADTNSFFILGALDTMATGFVSNLRINGEAWQASKGPLHLYKGFTALVAGRYRS